jgi:hypothetical protein
MKKGLPYLFAGWTLSCGGLVPALGAREPWVLVNVSNLAGFDEMTVARAEEIVTGIFHAMGVQVKWEHLTATGPVRATSGTDDQVADFHITLVRTRAVAMGGHGNEVAVAALPESGQRGYLIWVFRPTLEDIVDDPRILTPQWGRVRLRNVLLAYTMAHELGHLLLGSAEHSNSGILTLGWDLRKVRLACMGSLRFSPEQAEKIRATVQGMNNGLLYRANDPLPGAVRVSGARP